MNFHPDVLAAHAQFGGDLECMQKCYDWMPQDALVRLVELTASYCHGSAEYWNDKDAFVLIEMARRMAPCTEAAGANLYKLRQAPVPAPQPNLRDWHDISTAPLDKTAVIIAVPTKDMDDYFVGEAYFDPDCFEGGDWWWAGTANGDYASSSISDCMHHAPAYWQPMPTKPAAATSEGSDNG